MIDTKEFSEQHEDILNVAQQLAATLDVEALSRDAWDTRGLLSTLAGKLIVHLAMEDKILFPNLRNGPDENVRSVLQEFTDEMSGIAEVFLAYIDKWPHAMAVEERPQEFVDETQTILGVLGERVEKEEKSLYPMLQNSIERSKTILSGASKSVHAA